MALTRKMLSTMGIEEDKIDQIIEAHSDTVTALKDERDKFKKDAEKVPALEKEISEYKENIGKDDDFKKKYDEEHEAFESYKAEVAKKELNTKKSELYKKLLVDSGVDEKRIGSILKVTEIAKLEVDEDGKLKDIDKLNEQIKEDWGGFIVEERQKGAGVETPPETDKNINKDDFSKMTLSEQMVYINEHPEKATELLK